MKNVLLINPPQKFYKRSSAFGVYFPLGLLYIATVIRDCCNVKLYDSLIQNFQIIDENDFSVFGASKNNIEEVIREYNPDIIGITIPATVQSEYAIEVAKLCREIDPNIAIVFGGADASVQYEMYLRNELCDYCIVGEGEESFRELVQKYQSIDEKISILGVACMIDREVKYNQRPFIKQLDELPLPAYDLIPVESYLENEYLYINRSKISERSISLITSRGCPYECVFCSAKLSMGKDFRYHSAEYVINHIELLINKYGIRRFHIEDGNISLHRGRFEKILDMIIERHLDIQWDAPDGMRADSLDEVLLRKMKKSGCVEYNIAIEAGDQEVLDKIIKKKMILEKAIEIVKLSKKVGIKVNAFYVIGFPGETKETMKKTIDLALKLYQLYQVDPYITFATPMYKTELYNICVEQKLIESVLDEKEMSEATYLYGTPMIETNDFSKSDVKRLVLYFLSNLIKLGPPNYFNFAKDNHKASRLCERSKYEK